MGNAESICEGNKLAKGQLQLFIYRLSFEIFESKN
jgi:hypothetical protein